MKTRLMCLFLLSGCSFQQNSWSFDEVSNMLSDGKWVFEGESCSADYMTMSFDIKENIMILSLTDHDLGTTSNYEYKIIKVHRDGFLSQIRNEERLDETGSPVKWNFVIRNESTFYWSRNDWKKGYGTKNVIKCPK